MKKIIKVQLNNYSDAQKERSIELATLISTNSDHKDILSNIVIRSVVCLPENINYVDNDLKIYTEALANYAREIVLNHPEKQQKDYLEDIPVYKKKRKNK